MMLYKKTSFLILFLTLLPCVFWGQVKSGKVIYGVTPDQAMMDKILNSEEYDTKPKLKGYLRYTFKNEIKAAPYINYQLEFNKEKSRFEPQDYMDNDNGLDIHSAIANIGAKGTYYIDLKQRESLHLFTYFETPLTVTYLLDSLDWKLSKETREIQGYTCYKATVKFKPDSGLGEAGEIIAWYAPDLPYQYGPIVYGGLPGMILALKQGYYTFTAKKITLSKKPKEIKIHRQGEVYSIDDFEAARKRVEEQFKKTFN